MLVEDDVATLEAVRRLLTRRGHEVHVAESLAEARAVAGQKEIDLVICDVGLPDGSGVDLMTELRTRFHLVGIALSALGEPEDLRRSREAGFVTHLVKPVSIGVLEQALLAATRAAPGGEG